MLVTSKRVAVCEDLGPEGPRVGDCVLLLKKVYQPLNWLDREVSAHFQAGLWQAGLPGNQNELWVPCPWATFSQARPFPEPQWAERSRKGRREEAGGRG